MLPAAILLAAVTQAAVTPAAIVTPAPAGSPWSAERVVALRRDLDALLGGAGLRGAHVGVYAIDATTGAPLYAHNAGDDFQPASTLKLLVGSAALERLRPGYRFRTTADAEAPDGQTQRLVLRGGGDPFLSVADLDAAAAAAAKAGPYLFGTQWLADDSHFDRRPYPEGWTWDDFPEDYAARISAVTFEENVLHVHVTPGSSAGAPAQATSQPVDDVERPSTTSPVDQCYDASTVRVAATTGAAGSESTLDVMRSLGNCNVLVGSIPLDSAGETVDVAVKDPPAYAAAYLARRSRELLHSPGPSQRGDATPSDDSAAAVTSFAGNGLPVGSVFWTHDSEPLREWLGPLFWIPSDNLVAETLLKELGFAAGGKPGTTDKGIAYEKTWLQGIGVDPATVTLADGSGLSQYDRITPRDLVAILAHDWSGPNRALILASLPVGGARGTIEGIAGTPAAGRVFAKTGSMSHVRGLAGYLAPRRHGAVIFAFSVDDWIGRYPALAAVRAAVLSRIVED